MEHKITITLPDEIYRPLVEAALAQGRTPEEVATERLAKAVPRPHADSPADKGRADVTRYFGIWDSGDPDSADNDRIDADLAREYANTHDEE
jgi:protein involved in polysaccharide export with SLBB domain